QEGNQKQNFRKGSFQKQQRSKRKQDRFTLFTKTPKEIFALEKGKFKAPPPMKTPVEKWNHTKFYEFHGEVGHNTDEPKVDLVQNNEALGINLDLLEEQREEAAIREVKNKARMEKYYNSKVKNTRLKLGDLVYRNNNASRTEDTGKLGPKWEGPYEVTESLGKGAYKLRDHDGKQLQEMLYSQNVSNSRIQTP
nr:reverse transcriptase domain-containing protein [Tanacetum cinerariifolium]